MTEETLEQMSKEEDTRRTLRRTRSAVRSQELRRALHEATQCPYNFSRGRVGKCEPVYLKLKSDGGNYDPYQDCYK